MAGVIDDYVSVLARELRGPRRIRMDMIAEARDGLADAAEALERSGLARAEAENRAVAEFGPVREIAPGYQEELVASQARRTARLLFLCTPLITLMWSGVWLVLPAHATAPWSDKPEWFMPVARTIDVMQIVTGVLAGVLLLLLGRGAGWRVPGRRRAGGRGRARAMAWTLGLVIWCQFPLVFLMGTALSIAGQVEMDEYLPGMAATVISVLLTAWQLRSAAHCLSLCHRSSRLAGPARA
jgi:hypothetical protein